jgi:ApbE superfamily uncharacterized protein (UPF0280 family)
VQNTCVAARIVNVLPLISLPAGAAKSTVLKSAPYRLSVTISAAGGAKTAIGGGNGERKSESAEREADFCGRALVSVDRHARTARHTVIIEQSRHLTVARQSGTRGRSCLGSANANAVLAALADWNPSFDRLNPWAATVMFCSQWECLCDKSWSQNGQVAKLLLRRGSSPR